MRKNKSHKEAQRKYQKTAKGKAAQRRYAKTENGKKVRQEAQKRFYLLHPERKNATTVVSNAIRDGILPHPDTLKCYYCPKQAEQYHHWHGYEPEHLLDVVPVCAECHHECRRKIT